MKKVGIHQPNFFPWLGYFDKIKKADTFVFMDDVLFARRNWMTRAYIDDHNEAMWLSCPVVTTRGDRMPVVRLENFGELGKYITGRFQSVYTHAPYFEDIMGFLKESFQVEQTHLSTFNIKMIRTMLERFEIKTPLLLQTDLNIDHSLRANDLLIAICKKAEGQAYLCGGGASEYQDDTIFTNAGLGVVYQNYKEPRYRDTQLRGLSILDALAHLGWEKTAELIHQS